MDGRTLRRALGALLIPFITAGVMAQGLYFEISNNRGGGERVSYMPHMLKVENNDGQRITILRLDKQQLITLNPRDKTYSVTSLDQYAARLSGKRDATSRMEQKREDERGQGGNQQGEREKERIDKNPSTEKSKAEKAEADKNALGPVGEQEREKERTSQSSHPQGVQGGAAAVPDVKETADLKKIAGHECTKYEVRQGGTQEATLWVAKDVPELDAMKKDLQQLVSRFSSAQGKEPNALRVLNKVDGFPMMMERDGNTQTVTALRQQSIPSSAFEIPQGYKQVSR